MVIFNRKQDLRSEDGDGVVHRGPLTMAIFQRKQDMPSEDWGGGGMINWGPFTIAILKFQFTGFNETYLW